MSLPHNGSTAPTITSPLLAWPSLPVARSPLSPSPSGSFNSAIPAIYSRRDVKGKGKAEPAPELSRAVHGDPYSEQERERRYGPPKQPLTPRQLSRIAQSFGIVVPTLPPPSPEPSFPDSPLAGPSRLRAEPRPSPYLLTVVPPLSLLGLKSTSAEEAEKRTRKWRRGRLIPLQASLQGMLVAIAREFGLPSTTGLQLFMSASGGSSAASTSTSSDDPGPQISWQTWSTLFAAHLSMPTSRSSTPSSTPLKGTGPLGRDMAFPLSPLSLVEKQLDQRSRGIKLDEPVSAPSRLLDPLTPALQGNPVIGTVEFDIDTDLAAWYPEWQRNGRYRKSSTSSESGIRPLRLPRNMSSASAASIRQLRARTAEPRDSEVFDADGDTTLNDHDGDYSYTFSVHGEGITGKPFPPLRSKSTGRRLSVRRAGRQERLVSTAGSFGEIDLGDGDDDRVFGAAREGRDTVPEITLDGSGADEYGVHEEDLLASPIELDSLGRLKAADRVAADGKRGSAMVMSEQLDDLERIMRQLSPRDIRLTSPRMLTPRMAAKVATSKLQFPSNPSAAPGRSALGQTSANSSSSSLSSVSGGLMGGADKSTLTINTVSTVPSFDATTLSRPPLEAEYSDAGMPLPAWPAVPYAKLAESPGSPGSIHDYFRGAAVPSSPISNETLSRMRPFEDESATLRVSAPRRPQRPPSPEFGLSPIPSQALSPELVDHLRSPGLATPTSPPATASDGMKRSKGRSGSISLKGLKHMSSKNFGWKRADHAPPPALPLVPRDQEPEQALGLFGGAKVSPQSSTFPGLHSAGLAGEFGQGEKQSQVSTLPPAKSKDPSSFARWNPFGSKKTSAPPAIPTSDPHQSSEPISTPKGKDRESKTSRRNPSIDRKDIGSPLSGSLKRMQRQHDKQPHQTSPSLSSVRSGQALTLSQSHSRPSLPGLSSSGTTRTLSSEAGPPEDAFFPGSPGQMAMSPRSRSVKRKPVPSPRKPGVAAGAEDDEDGYGAGVNGSLSYGSLAGFAGDDRRAGLGVRVG